MRNAIITLATHHGNYVSGLSRLSNSLRNNFDGDFLAWVHEYALGAPLHIENPYAFKVYAFKRAFELGYDNVLWLDCSAFAVKNVQPIFERIEKAGCFFQEAGHWLGEWSNDRLLKYFSLSRDEAMALPMVMGGIIGLRKDTIILKYLQDCMEQGVFKGSWNNDNKTESDDERCKGHRHEMSAVSAIVHEANLYGLVPPHVIQYAGYYDETPEHVIIKFQGL